MNTSTYNSIASSTIGNDFAAFYFVHKLPPLAPPARRGGRFPETYGKPVGDTYMQYILTGAYASINDSSLLTRRVDDCTAGPRLFYHLLRTGIRC